MGIFYMKKKTVAIAVIIVLTTLTLCGCNGQESTKTQDKNMTTEENNNLDIGLKDGFLVDENGGDFSLFDDQVKVNVKHGSVTEPVDITIETISDPVEDLNIIMLSCFDFGPDGTMFKNPIDVIIRYDENNLPTGVEESDIKVYVLNENTWEIIEDSFANKAMHWAVASVSHFTKMGCGASAPAIINNNGDDSDDTDDNNNSAQYWFKADIYYYSHSRPRSELSDSTEYDVGVSAYWKPVSYVQYYEIKFDFKGNLPKNYAWHCDYRDQGKSSCSKSSYPINEGYIYHLGGNPEIQGFLSTIKSGDCIAGKVDPDTGKTNMWVYARVWPENRDGYDFFGVHTNIDDPEDLTEIETGVIISEMETFVKDYVNNWEVWVRGVTETQS